MSRQNTQSYKINDKCYLLVSSEIEKDSSGDDYHMVKFSFDNQRYFQLGKIYLKDAKYVEAIPGKNNPDSDNFFLKNIKKILHEFNITDVNLEKLDRETALLNTPFLTMHDLFPQSSAVSNSHFFTALSAVFDKSVDEKKALIDESLSFNSEMMMNWTRAEEQIYRYEEENIADPNWRWMARNEENKLSENDKSETLNALLALSVYRKLYFEKNINPYSISHLYLTHHFFNIRNYTYSKTKLDNNEEIKNNWDLKIFCIHAIYCMKPVERKAFFSDLYSAIANYIADHPNLPEKMPEIPVFTFKLNNEKNVTLPISDHILIQQVITIKDKKYNVGSFNIWCPGSPISPQMGKLIGNQISSNGSGEYRLPVEHHELQLTAIADYLILQIKNNIHMIALQEIPDPKATDQSKKNFALLKQKIRDAALRENLFNHDENLLNEFIDSFEKNFTPKAGHAFGNSILVDPRYFNILSNQTTPMIMRAEEPRGHVGCQYRICAVDPTLDSFYFFNLINFHADMDNLAQYNQIQNAVNDGIICLGDTNSHHSMQHFSGMQITKNSIIRPILFYFQHAIYNGTTIDVIFAPKKMQLSTQITITTSQTTYILNREKICLTDDTGSNIVENKLDWKDKGNQWIRLPFTYKEKNQEKTANIYIDKDGHPAVASKGKLTVVQQACNPSTAQQAIAPDLENNFLSLMKQLHARIVRANFPNLETPMIVGAASAGPDHNSQLNTSLYLMPTESNELKQLSAKAEGFRDRQTADKTTMEYKQANQLCQILERYQNPVNAQVDDSKLKQDLDYLKTVITPPPININFFNPQPQQELSQLYASLIIVFEKIQNTQPISIANAMSLNK